MKLAVACLPVLRRTPAACALPLLALVAASTACTARPELFGADTSAPDAGTQPRPGLRGEYFRDTELRDFAGVFIDPRIDFADNRLYDLGGARTGSGDRFSIRWTGEIFLRAGERTLTVVVAQGARLFVGGRLLLDAWRTSRREHSAVVPVAADGWRALRLEYFHDAIPADIQLLVSNPTGHEVVAAADLRHF